MASDSVTSWTWICIGRYPSGFTFTYHQFSSCPCHHPCSPSDGRRARSISLLRRSNWTGPDLSVSRPCYKRISSFVTNYILIHLSYLYRRKYRPSISTDAIRRSWTSGVWTQTFKVKGFDWMQGKASKGRRTSLLDYHEHQRLDAARLFPLMKLEELPIIPEVGTWAQIEMSL